MSNKLFEEFLKRIPLKIKNFNRLSMGIAVAIDEELKSKGLTQKDLADKLEKRESEISKWLSGKHNFTIKSIANIEAALNVELLTVNKQRVNTELPIEFKIIKIQQKGLVFSSNNIASSRLINSQPKALAQNLTTHKFCTNSTRLANAS